MKAPHGSLVLRGRSHTQHTTAATAAMSVWIIKRLLSFHKSSRPDSSHCVSFKVVDKLCNVHEIVFGRIFCVPSPLHIWGGCVNKWCRRCCWRVFARTQFTDEALPLKHQESGNLENAPRKLLRNAESSMYQHNKHTNQRWDFVLEEFS